MRKLSLTVPLLCLTALAAAPPNPAEYPTSFEVVTGSKIGSFMIGNFCTMSLSESDDPSLTLIVQRRHGCHTWDANMIFRGRREKKVLKLVVKDEKGNLRVEDWPIVGSVSTPR